jgi:hypothetical protein
MFTNASYRAAVVGRWIARIMGTLMALFYLAFVVGEGPPPLFRLGLQQNLHFLGLTALFLGLLLAWKWDLWGGLIPLAGFVLLFAVDARSMGRGLALFLAPLAVAVLSLLCWWGLRAGPPAGGVAWQAPRPALIVAGACVTVFVALCANEIIGNPPLMTPSLRPPAAMLGEWSGATRAFVRPASDTLDVVFVIHPDGFVTGSIGDAAVLAGRIECNRSWFGKLMNWRADYAIRGRLSHAVQVTGHVAGDQFSAPLMSKAQELDGSLFLAGQPVRISLRKD